MAATFAAALAVRLLYLAAFRHSSFFDNLLVDAQWHDEWARRWAAGNWDLEGRAFFRAPLYPLWLAALYAVGVRDLLLVRGVQAVLGALTASFLAGTGYRWGGRTTGLAAGLLAAFYGPLVFFDGALLIPNLLLFLLTAMLFVLSVSVRRGASAAAGLLLGLAAVARPNALALLPAVGYWVWKGSATGGRRRLESLALVMVLGTAPALVVTGINAAVEGTWVFVASQGGVNFYAGNHAHASGRGVEIPELANILSWRQFVKQAEEVAEREAGRDLDSGEVSSWWFRRGLDWIVHDPGAAGGLYLRKLYYLVNAREIPNNRDLYSERVGPLRWLLVRTRWGALPWGLVFPLAAAGLVLAWRDPAWRVRARFLGLWFAIYGAAILPFFVTARYRMALVPPVLLLAAAALSRVRNLVRPRPLIVFLAALVVSNSGLAGMRDADRGLPLARRGEVYLRENRNDEALAVLEEAHRLDPGALVTDLLLAEAYMRAGRADAAVPLYVRVAAARPEDPKIHFNLGVAYLRESRFREAATSFEAAVRLDPGRAWSWINLGLAREGGGEPDRAAEAYRKGIALAPEEELGYLRLGAILEARGQAGAALDTLRTGAERLSGSFTLQIALAEALDRAGEAGPAKAALERAREIRPRDPRIRELEERLGAGTGNGGEP